MIFTEKKCSITWNMIILWEGVGNNFSKVALFILLPIKIFSQTSKFRIIWIPSLHHQFSLWPYWQINSPKCCFHVTTFLDDFNNYRMMPKLFSCHLKALRKRASHQLSTLFFITSITNYFIPGNLSIYSPNKSGLALLWCL